MPAVERTMYTQERLVFAPSVEALLIRGVGTRMTSHLRDQLRGLGIDLEKPLLPAYRSDVWQQAVDLIAQELHPGSSMGEAQRKLGESTVSGWEQTLIGKAMITLTKLYGPRRILLRFPQMSKSSNNYSSMTVKEVSPLELEMVCHPFEGWPEYVQGCICAVASMAGAKEPRVEVVRHDRATEQLVLRTTWKT